MRKFYRVEHWSGITCMNNVLGNYSSKVKAENAVRDYVTRLGQGVLKEHGWYSSDGNHEVTISKEEIK